MRARAKHQRGELRRRMRRALWHARHPQPQGAPQRPTLSPLLPALAFAWAGISAGTAAGIGTAFDERWLGLPPVPALGLACLLATLAGLAVACVAPRLRAFATLALVGLLGGTLAGGAFIAATLASGQRLQEAPVSTYSFVIESDPKRGAMGAVSFEATVARTSPAAMRHAPDPTGARVWVSLASDAMPQAPLRMGDAVRLVGSWNPLANDEWGSSLLSRGCAGAIKAKRCSREGAQGGLVGVIRQLRSRMLDALDPTESQQRALIAGVVLGEQASLSAFPVNRDFSNLGLTHLVAVSGSHLAVIAGIMGIALSGLRLRPGARLVSSTLVLGAYVILSGLQPSAIRSLAMVLAAQGATLTGRRSHVLSALGGVALVMLLVEPANAGRMGFALSVLSVLGIAALAGLVGHWLGMLVHPLPLPRGIRDALALTLVSQMLTMPLTLPAFGVLPLLSPLANVLAAPIMSALLLLGIPCVPLSWAVPALAPALLAPCDVLAGLACDLAGGLAKLPYAALPCEVPAIPCALACGALALGAYALWPLPRPHEARLTASAPLAIVAVLFVSWRLLAPARVVVLDVGQGDAILIQQGPSALLVDTGPGDAVLAALARAHVLHLDAVLLTHTDADHTGGLGDLDGLVGVGEVIVAQGVYDHIQQDDAALRKTIEDLTGGRVREVAAGDVLRVGAFELGVASPAQPVAGDENPDSIVAVARYGTPDDDRALSVLLTGDAEQDLTGPLSRSGAFGDVDVLKVGHHGSAISTSQELLRGCGPELAVVSAGAQNRYGHPTQACRDELEAAGIPLLCTIEAGDIELRPGSGGVDVRCQRPQALGAALGTAAPVLLGAGLDRKHHGVRRCAMLERHMRRDERPAPDGERRACGSNGIQGEGRGAAARLPDGGRRRAQAAHGARAPRQAPRGQR